MLVETLLPAINAGVLGTGFSVDDMDYSRMSNAGGALFRRRNLKWRIKHFQYPIFTPVQGLLRIRLFE